MMSRLSVSAMLQGENCQAARLHLGESTQSPGQLQHANPPATACAPLPTCTLYAVAAFTCSRRLALGTLGRQQVLRFLSVTEDVVRPAIPPVPDT